MKYLLLVSHGNYSTGLKQTLEMFAGTETMESVIAVGLMPGESASHLGTRFSKTLATLPADAQFVILADIIGGSPLTTVYNTLHEFNRANEVLILGGMNFSMALTVALAKDNLSNEELKAKAKAEAIAAIKELQTDLPVTIDEDI
ncbi:PTS sugar transporter subunit IIA [Lacticaseibacillus hulanensis]|uniref:PTS sugar transporter subunit IIA n=1 Tax=Lacticaseibacillus hulanensis TaxID=2493111 RepID=UPI000FDC5E15|nr:PTS fructose transporter subunit IIA [Lacticaseibacillus hulanensis]